MAKANAKFMAPLTPSAELAVIVGSAALPRTEVVKKMWDYIKKNGLQDAKNKRMINADDKLAAIFEGKKQISMFDMEQIHFQTLVQISKRNTCFKRTRLYGGFFYRPFVWVYIGLMALALPRKKRYANYNRTFYPLEDE